MAVSAAQLDYLVSTLRLVTGAAGRVEPGHLVEAKVISSLTDLTGTDVGAVSVPIERPVQLDVSWSVVDHTGTERHENEGFVASDGLTGPVVGFVFMPPIDSLSTRPTAPAKWTIKATVTLTAEGAGSVTRDLEVPVELVKLEIPVLLALFRLRDFQSFQDSDVPGFVLMVVPEDSILQGLAQPFNELMIQIEDAVRPLRAIAGIAEFLTGIGVLRQALSVQPLARIKRGAIDDMEDVHMDKETFLNIDILNRDLRAGDRVSSMILMGPCGTRVGCYQDENQSLSDGEWAFNLVVGPEMITVVRDLSGPRPPKTFPLNRIFVRQDSGDDFEDDMSSVEFDPPRADDEPETERLCAPAGGGGGGGGPLIT
jgi:hypothetical protein